MLQSNLEQLKKVFRDFYNITGIMLVLYDTNFNILCNYPHENAPICEEIRKHDVLLDRCFKCDLCGLNECKEKKRLIIYECHMGLTEAISPILESDNVIGYLMLGQTVPENRHEQIRQKIHSLPKDIVTDKTSMLEALDETTVISKETLFSAARIMDICTCYISQNKFNLSQHSTLHHQIDKYIRENLSDPELSMNSICHRFLISRSPLYSLSKKAFGMGISEYITFRRIEKAKKMLLEKKYSIATVSRSCGFKEPSYFSRVFKRETGVLPKTYETFVKKNISSK